MDISNYITKIDKFSKKCIDIENIDTSKTIYNIYNNTIKEPFHKFWFILNNCKFIKIYENSKTTNIKFALNDKNEKHNLLLEFIKKIIINTHLECIKLFDDITYSIPWKHNDNYPIILTFYNKEFTILDENNEELTIDSLLFNNELTYTILFEINYFIIKDNNIKFILSCKLIQFEKNKNKLLKNGILNISLEEKKYYHATPINENKPIIKNDITIQHKPQLFLNKDMIMEKRNQLKSIININNEDKIIEKTIGEQFLDQKKILKKIDINKEEYVEDIVVKKKKKSKNTL